MVMSNSYVTNYQRVVAVINFSWCLESSKPDVGFVGVLGIRR